MLITSNTVEAIEEAIVQYKPGSARLVAVVCCRPPRVGKHLLH